MWSLQLHRGECVTYEMNNLVYSVINMFPQIKNVFIIQLVN